MLMLSQYLQYYHLPPNHSSATRALSSLQKVMDIPLNQIQPVYTNHTHKEDPAIHSLLSHFNLHPHPEGGYFRETDRSTLRIPNPFQSVSTTTGQTQDEDTRAASSAIYYLLTPDSPLGAFHRNSGRTTHTWHRGRGRYVIIHPASEDLDGHDGDVGNCKAEIETFVVGPNVECGERMQWVVDGGKYKASFLLPDSLDQDQDGYSGGLLISEVCRYIPPPE